MIECFNPLVVLVKIGSYQLGKSTIINKIQSFYSRNATLNLETSVNVFVIVSDTLEGRRYYGGQ